MSFNIADIEPVIGADFEKITLLDKKEYPALKEKFNIQELNAGGFCSTDTELQCVEMDLDIKPVPEFPYNWCYDRNSGNPESFTMKLSCKKLLLVFKDSDKASYGVADVFVDGKKVLEADPLKVGWTHCNAVILLNDKKTKTHKVEIRMAVGSENKKFTILGFGIA